MSASYDNESTADLDWVRAQLGDTDTANPLHSDERIAFVLAQHPGQRILALGQLAHELVATFGQQPDTVKLASGLSVSFKNLLDSWIALSLPYRAWLSKQAALAQGSSQQAAAWSGDVETQVVW